MQVARVAGKILALGLTIFYGVIPVLCEPTYDNEIKYDTNYTLTIYLQNPRFVTYFAIFGLLAQVVTMGCCWISDGGHDFLHSTTFHQKAAESAEQKLSAHQNCSTSIE